MGRRASLSTVTGDYTRNAFGEGATLYSMKPTFSAWLVTGLFLAVLIAVVVLSYSPRPYSNMITAKVLVGLLGLIALYLHCDQARK